MSWRKNFLKSLEGEGGFVEDGQEWPFHRVLESAQEFAEDLRTRGVDAGDAVGVRLESPIANVIALVGNYLRGCVHVPINTRYTRREVDHIVEEAGLKCIVGDEFTLFSDVPASPYRGDDEDIAIILFTSGTTGRPKAVELSYRAVLSNIDALTKLWRWTPDDTLVLSLPLFHVHGLGIGVHGTILRGCWALLRGAFDAEDVVSAFEGKNGRAGSIFMGVPTMYSRLITHLESRPEACKALSRGRLFTSGSAPLSTSDFDAFRRLTGHTILERYGMSETMLTLSNLYEDRRRGMVGRPVGDTEIRVVDECGEDISDGIGELWVRGSSLMSGYRGRAQETKASFENGWFKTGDMVEILDGFVSIVGRRSTDIIKSGGFKVGAREIEEVIREHEWISDVAVFGASDTDLGERVVAALVLSGEHGHLEPEVLKAGLDTWCREHLTGYKIPRDLLVLVQLPRNPMGKVQKPRLKEIYESTRT